MVGDTQVPLVRIVPVAGRDGEMITRAFDHIQNCPLAQRRLVGLIPHEEGFSVFQFHGIRVVVVYVWYMIEYD
jgi:hypothetical protein